MYRPIMLAVAATLALILAPVTARAATATGYNKFSIPQKYDVAVEWYEAHRGGVLKASNCRIAKDLGEGKYQVQTSTPLGTCEYVLKETRKDSTNDDGQRITIYRLEFVRNVSGRVTYQRVIIQLTEAGDKTTLQEWVKTTVAGRFVPTFAVSNVLQQSINGCERYVLENSR